MARAKNESEHLEISRKLTSWAQSNEVMDDAYVRGLADALSNRKNLAHWATLSPLELLPKVSVQVRGSRLVTLVTLLKNTLIFAPVALTWSAVGHASDAFGIYVTQNAGAVVNFLQFWQNGYGVLGETWRIAHIATLDFLLITTVIGLILFLHFINQRTRNRRKKAEKIVDNERMELALEISEYLFRQRAVSDLTLKDTVATAMHNLLNATSDAKTISKELVKANKENSVNNKMLSELKKISKAGLFDRDTKK